MNFDFSDDQKQLRDQARKFLAEKCPPKAVRVVLDGKAPYDKELWKGLAEMGFLGVAIPEGVVAALNTPIGLAQKYLVDPVKHYQHRTIIPLEGGHGSTLGGTIATMASATAACLFLASTPDLLALARGGADKASAEAIAWTLGTALGLKYVAARA